MNLTKTTNGEKFVLAINENEPEKFILVVDQKEIDLIGVSVEQFGGNRIYDAGLREDAQTLVSAMWQRQQQMQKAEQLEQDRKAEEQKNQDDDKNAPD